LLVKFAQKVKCTTLKCHIDSLLTNGTQNETRSIVADGGFSKRDPEKIVFKCRDLNHTNNLLDWSEICMDITSDNTDLDEI
jgi:hypothetical protein